MSPFTIHPHQSAPPGMTLIETLAVIVILSLVTGALGVSLSGNTRSAQARATMARWRDLDGQARIAAQVEGAVRLQLDEDRDGITLRTIRTGELLGELRWSEGCKGSMAIGENNAVTFVDFDSRGRSHDYSLTLWDLEREADGSMLSTRVCGLTGWFVQETQR